jgi:thermonuclease
MIFSIIKKLLIFSFLLPIIVFANTKEKVKFVKCVDGDTAKFERNNKVFTLRFLAVNTPETKSPKKGVEFYGKEASNYTCKRLQEAKTIEIEYDNKSERKDRYGRNLGWVFLDDKLLQKDLVENGYAKVDYIYDKYKYVEELKEIEKKAKEAKKGLWQKESNNTINSKKKTKKNIFSIILDVLQSIVNLLSQIFKVFKLT